jgi:hypothetical protein
MDWTGTNPSPILTSNNDNHERQTTTTMFYESDHTVTFTLDLLTTPMDEVRRDRLSEVRAIARRGAAADRLAARREARRAGRA